MNDNSSSDSSSSGSKKKTFQKQQFAHCSLKNTWKKKEKSLKNKNKMFEIYLKESVHNRKNKIFNKTKVKHLSTRKREINT